MNLVYADSGYWIALQNPRDQWHRKAVEVTERLGDFRIVTSAMVLVEYLNGVSRLGSHSRQLAVATVQRLYASRPFVTVVPQSDEQLQAAMNRYVSRLDQRWSVTDCASFLIMEELGITDALAYDRDFAQAGFRPLLRED